MKIQLAAILLRKYSRFMLVIALASVEWFSGCSTNPATGERHLNLVSEDQEINMGRQADQEISTSLGLYPDSSLQRYIQQLGMKLAQTSERPELPWTFRVVDDPVVNAFALPGGFIYVTRGILSHLENEAELAGVVGHEIGHVTAKHSVNRMSTQQLAQLGLGLGMILKPELQQYGQLASAGLGILFLKFSRDDESQADALGVRYMRRGSFDPRQMSEVMTMLDRVSQASGGGRIPEWLATHPNPSNRKEHIQELIDTVKGGFSGTAVNKESYLRRLDGIIFGQNPREGFFRGTTFYQPDLKFKVEFPEGWKTSNQKQAVVGASAQQDAVIQITLAKQKSAESAASEFFSQQGVTGQRGAAAGGIGNIHGFPTASGMFTAQTEQGVIQGLAVFLEHDGHVYQLLGYTAQQGWSKYGPILEKAITSFDKLTDSKALNAQPQRLKLVTIDKAMTLEEFNRQYPSAVSLETLALINQVEPGTRLNSGQNVKRIIGEKFE